MFPFAVALLGGFLLIQASQRDKAIVLKYFTVTVQWIIGIAVFGWILYLSGVNLPNFIDYSDSFYRFTIFYIFNLNGMPGEDIFPRFAGPFLEPGHCGTMSIFLLYIDRFRLKKFGNIILLAAVLMSLSLAAYGLLIMAVALVLIQNRQFVAMIVSVLVFVGIGVVAMDYNNGLNAVNEKIVSRLEIGDDGEIVGNNRTSAFFDLSYAKYIKSDRVWLGVGRAAFGSSSDGKDNVTIGTSGYKRFFYLRGIIGSILSLVFLFYYASGYWNSKSFGFLIVYMTANLIRDYITMEMWMYLFLLAMPVIYYNLNVKQKQHIKRVEG